MKKVLAFVAVLSVAGMVSADLMVVVEASAVQPKVPGLSSYTVYLVADTLDNAASSVDGSFRGDVFQAGLSSVYAGDIAVEAAQDDSCIIVPEANLAVGRAVAELNDQSHPGWLEAGGTGPLTAGWLIYLPTVPPPTERWLEGGIGDIGAGSGAAETFALGIVGDYQVTNLPFAQIVIPDGGTVTFEADLAKRGGGGVHAEVIIPEPATLSLLVLGGFGALLRRRR